MCCSRHCRRRCRACWPTSLRSKGSHLRLSSQLCRLDLSQSNPACRARSSASRSEVHAYRIPCVSVRYGALSEMTRRACSRACKSKRAWIESRPTEWIHLFRPSFCPFVLLSARKSSESCRARFHAPTLKGSNLQEYKSTITLENIYKLSYCFL